MRRGKKEIIYSYSHGFSCMRLRIRNSILSFEEILHIYVLPILILRILINFRSFQFTCCTCTCKEKRVYECLRVSTSIWQKIEGVKNFKSTKKQLIFFFEGIYWYDTLYLRSKVSLSFSTRNITIFIQNSSCRVSASPKSVACEPTNRSYLSSISSLVNLLSASVSAS